MFAGQILPREKTTCSEPMRQSGMRIFDALRHRYILYRYVYPFVHANRFRQISRQNTICLFTQPRSGSTWLTRILATLPDSCYFDEPLQRSPVEGIDGLPDRRYKKVQQVADLGFYYEQPIPPGADWPEALGLFDRLLGGRQPSPAIYEECGFGRLRNAETYIIKFNCGALLMDWLLQHFDVRAVCLVRHPCAVIASQLKLDYYSRIRIPESPALPAFRYDEAYRKYDRLFRTIRSPEQYLAFRWALSVSTCLDCAQKRAEVLLLRYEDLICDYAGETARLFRHLDRPVPAEVASLRHQPSPATPPESMPAIRAGVDPDTWKKRLSPAQITDIASMVGHFGIDLYPLE